MKTGQNFTLGRGEERVQRFVAVGCAGATAAQWYCALSPDTAAGHHDLDLTTGGGGIVLNDAGADAHVDLTFTAVQTEALPVGRRWHELWITLGGLSARRATGTVTVQDTLKN
jgi:hypothetical protein